MRWLSILKDVVKDIFVPIAVAGIAAYATIKATEAAPREDKGEEDKASRNTGSHCCCGCNCRRGQTEAAADTPKEVGS